MDIDEDLPAQTLKLLLLGGTASGKSELLARWAHGDILPEYVPTLGIDCRSRIEQFETKAVRVLVWELGGQEAYQMFLPMLMRSLDALAFVYDQSEVTSFELVTRLVEELGPVLAQLPLFLIATHCDLPIVVSDDEAKSFAAKSNMLYLTSYRNTDVCALAQAVTATFQRKQKSDAENSKKPSEKTKSNWCFPTKSPSQEEDSAPKKGWRCFRKSQS